MFWLEGSHLQLEYEILVQTDMVEEQVEVEGCSSTVTGT
jgi:hypothetical protein